MAKKNCCLCGDGPLGFMAKADKVKGIKQTITKKGLGDKLLEFFEDKNDDDEVCLYCFGIMNDGNQSVDGKYQSLQARAGFIEHATESSAEQKERAGQLAKKTPEYKAQWHKDGIIQFKNERIAILQRMWGAQVQFIVAFDEVTKEGYRLMAIDEGKTANAGGFSGGANAYFYFQKMEYVK